MGSNGEDSQSPNRKAQTGDGTDTPSTPSRNPGGVNYSASTGSLLTPPSKSLTTGRRPDPGLRLGGFTQLDTDIPDSDSDEEGQERWKSGPTTPSIAETAAQLRRSLSVHGLHELAQNPAQIRHKLWRPADDPAHVPHDYERVIVHSFRGGLRALLFAFGCRGTVMLLFALVKAFRTKKWKTNPLVLAFFGPTNVRFASVFGLWTLIYKAVHNGLRLVTPMPERVPRRKRSASGDGSASGSATPRSGYSELEGKTGEERAKLKNNQKKRAFMRDPRSKVWHAYVAGALSGLAILAEAPGNRIGLAQQLVVRGLEGTYNVAHGKGLITIPYGSVLAFGMACGQIMYAWIDAPESLPRSYVKWITEASKVTPICLKVHRDHEDVVTNDCFELFPGGKFPDLIKMPNGKMRYPNLPATKANRRGMTGKNVAKVVAWKERTDKGKLDPFVPCCLVHPWEDSHWWSPVDRFVEVTRWILPVYATLHFVPAIFLRMGAFRKDPWRILSRAAFGSLRSSSFLGVFVIIFQTFFCGCHSILSWLDKFPSIRDRVPGWFIHALTKGEMHWFAGFLTCFSLFIEHSKRRTELAMYVLPKGAESAWSVARKRSWVPFVPGGDLLLTSAGMSLVMGTYAQSPEHLSGIVRRVVYQFVGHN
ncbi:Uncharacterized conserved protein [Ceraceosorus bombacis]|uniref:Uncharacterized conserved protein n=1 Tax=Ceraceosorus bombacis TaxID=401625 RepID=A0A0P1BN03_9BASI|nr:Uncharacterized conserved protein [Ceraceosorus bombacis]